MAVPSRAQATAWFEECDQSGDGCVSVQELQAKITENLGVCDEDVAIMFSACDKNCDKKITKEELLEEVLKEPREKTINKLFAKYDTDESGQLTLKELENALAQEGTQLDCDCIREMFNEADKDGSTKVDLKEFKDVFKAKY